MNPKSDEQIRGESDQFPTNEEQQQAVGDDHAEHRRGEKREISEEASEVLVPRHVADAEDENEKRDEGNHEQHRGGKRIEHPSDAHGLFAEGEPGEIVNRAKTGRGQRWQQRGEREHEGDNLTEDRNPGGCSLA